MTRHDCTKQLTIFVGALLISISSTAQMYLWQGGQPTSADLDSITFTDNGKADNAFTIVENTLSMYEGATYALTLEDNIYPANQYHWTSGNTRVATVDANGTITAKNQGMTIIMATYGARTQMCILWVYETHIEEFQFSQATLKLIAGVTKPVALQMCCLSDEVVKPTITYTSSDPRVVTVDAEGNATGMKEGTAKIIASILDMSDTCDVIVYEKFPYVTVQLEITNIAQKKCTVSVTPSYEEGYYYCGYGDVATIGSMSDSELTELVLTNIQAVVKQDTFVTMKDFLQQGTKNMTVSGLTASTDYVMFAFGVDVDNEKASPIVTRLPFRTIDVVPSSMTITLQYDSASYVTKSSGKVDTLIYFSAHPSTDKETYLLGGAEKGYLTEKFNGDPAVYMQNIEAYYDKQGTLENYLRTGVISIRANNPEDGSQWVIIAAGYDGGFTTKMFTMEYTYNAPKNGKPARLVRKDTEEDNTSELNVIPMMLGEDMPLKEGNIQVLPLPVGMMHL